jgi:triphosphatase
MSAPRKWSRPALPASPTAGEAFVGNARAALEQVNANAAGAAAGRDPEYLHQLRVGVRRLRSALRAFRKLLRRREADAIERPWRAMMRALGAARDWDVFLQTLQVAPLRAEAVRSRDAAQRRVRKLLRGPRFVRARDRSFVWAQGHPWRRHADPAQPLARFAARALQRLHRSLLREAAGIDWRDAPRRHRVRIRVKRVRYACDFFAAAFPHRRARAYLDGLRGLQDVLGEMNDIEVQRRLLRRLVPRKSPLPHLQAEAVVRARLAAREHELIGALAPAWSAFEERPQFWRAGRIR